MYSEAAKFIFIFFKERGNDIWPDNMTKSKIGVPIDLRNSKSKNMTSSLGENGFNIKTNAGHKWFEESPPKKIQTTRNSTKQH